LCDAVRRRQNKPAAAQWLVSGCRNRNQEPEARTSATSP
jgi:hypothetical protein